MNENVIRTKSCKLAIRIVKLYQYLGNDKREFVISKQVLRSGTSVLGNYVEGQSASSKKEFINFFAISLKSANESKVWLALLRDSKRAKPEATAWFLKEIHEIANILAASILTLKCKK